MSQPEPTPVRPEPTLRKGRLGVLGIVFFVVAAAAAVLVGMTGAVPVATSAPGWRP